MPKTANLPKRRRGRPPRAASAVQVMALRETGFSFRAIARTLGFGYGTIRRAYFGKVAKQEGQTFGPATQG